MHASPYKRAVFYIMSGTGNTYRMACWIKDIFRRHGVTAKIIMIEDADVDNDMPLSSDTLVATLFPTHGFMPPWSMIKFLFKMPTRPGVPAMCGATRGAYKIGPLVVPGASGFATFVAAMLLFLKGFRVQAIFSLDMPANLINVHPSLHPRSVKVISARSKNRLNRLIPVLLEGRKIWFTRNNLWESLWSVGILWWIPFFPILYLLIARMFMAKVMFANHHCVGCGMCARTCPNNAILMKKTGVDRIRPYWSYHCENCMRCMAYCKKKAVESGHSWAVLLYFITSVPVLSSVLIWLHETNASIPVINDNPFLEPFNILYFLPALFLSYWIFWHLIRFPVINAFFSYTTLSHYYRRYHQPGTRLTHLMQQKKRKTSLKQPKQGEI
jgi:ferredoxin